MSIFQTHDPRFLDLIRRIVHRRGGTPGQIAKAVREPIEVVEAALIHLKARGEIVYTRKKRPSKKGVPK